jgi:hypothetical protein
LRLILRRMWQGAFVLEDLSKIAAVDPPVAGWTSDEMLGLIFGWIAQTPSDVFPAGMPVTCSNPLQPHAGLQALPDS